MATRSRMRGAPNTSKPVNASRLPSPSPGLGRVPARWRNEVERVLITEEQIARRLRRIAREIERDFRGRDFAIVSLLNGTVMFLADLIRHLNVPLRLDFMGVS